MRLIRIIIPIVVAAVATGVAFDRAMSKTKTITVQQASGPLDHRIIALHGRLYPQGDNQFIFVDDTGRAEVKTCPVWHRLIQVKPGEEAVVIGERLPDRPQLEGTAFVMAAFTIEGSRSGVIQIRDQLGKPPWALNASSSGAPAPGYPPGLVDK